MAKPRNRGVGLGLFAAPVAPVNARMPGADPVSEQLADWAKKAKDIALLKQIQQGGAPVSEQGMPAPTSVGEVVQVATAVAGMHREVATTALERERMAKEELKEAKQEAGGAYESGINEGRGQMSMVMELMTKQQETVLQLMGNLATARVETVQSQAKTAIEQVQQTAEQAIKALASHNEALKQENERLRTRPPSPEEELGRSLLEPVRRAVLEKGLGVLVPPPPVAQADSPELHFQRRVADGLAEVTVAKAHDEVAAAREARAAKAQTTQVLTDIGKGVLGLVGDLRSVFTQAVGEPRGIDRHGIPAEFPQEADQRPAPAAAPVARGPAAPIYVSSDDEPSY